MWFLFSFSFSFSIYSSCFSFDSHYSRFLLLLTFLRSNRKAKFLDSIYENELSEFDSIHFWMDSHFPEPAWKRKRQPVNINLELKFFCALVHLFRYDSLLIEAYRSISEGQNPDIPKELETLWRSVISFREHCRKKKQEFSSHSSVSYNFAASQTVTAFRHNSVNSFGRSESARLRLDSQFQEANLSSLPSERRLQLRRMMSFVEDEEALRSTKSSTELKSKLPLHSSWMKESPVAENLDRNEEKDLLYTMNYEDYATQLLQKLELLMELNPPWDLNEDVSVEDGPNETLTSGREKILASLQKNSSLMIEEKGSIPETKEELLLRCVYKYLYINTTVTVKHLKESLLRRTNNAMNKRRIFTEGIQFMQQIAEFPQASRLFLLGIFHEMTVFSNRFMGGYHTGRRRREGSYGIDYLENCEGASHDVMKQLIDSLQQFCEYLKEEFGKCVDQLQWHLGGAILWFLSTIASPKLPYFAVKLDLLSLLESNMWKLNKWYEMANDYSKDLLISPGIFWDALSESPISLSSSHFHKMFREIQENSSYVNIQESFPGIFPAAVMSLANQMRLAYTILLIQQFSDSVSRSRLSPAQNKETLYNWTLTDVSNLFIRQSLPYLFHTQRLFDQFVRFFARMQRVMRERCVAWQPYAPINYNANNPTGNPYTCIKKFDEKNIMRGMIATDMLISAAEGVLSSFLALMLFISRTRATSMLPWKEYGNLVWEMVYSSPRHQKLATMLLQYIIPSTDYIPPVFESSHCEFSEVPSDTPETKSIRKNPFLQPPYFPQNEPVTEAKREAFIYFLLHLVSHSDSCPGAMIGERTSCALCCAFFPFIYNTLCPSSPAYSMPAKASYLEEVLITRQQIFVGICKMHIRPDGQTASFCSLVFAEEIAYLLRILMRESLWRGLMIRVFQNVLDSAASQLLEKPSVGSASGLHAILRSRTPCFCMATAVLKVLGAITPRLYAGCRIRIHEFLMEGENDISTLIHTAYQSQGTGSIIKYHRSMGEALVLLDKIETPRYINNYVFDVVDRIEPPQDEDDQFKQFLNPIQQIIQRITLNPELFSLPSEEMHFFNTSDLQLSPSELQNVILFLYCVRCTNHLVISNNSLVRNLSTQTISRLISIAVQPLPCNVSFNTLIVRQYFNWFIEYLIDTYVGSARLMPMELQNEEDGEVLRGRERVDPQFGFNKENDEEVLRVEEQEGPKVIRNEKRMKAAEELAALCRVDVNVAYAVLLVHSTSGCNE